MTGFPTGALEIAHFGSIQGLSAHWLREMGFSFSSHILDLNKASAAGTPPPTPTHHSTLHVGRTICNKSLGEAGGLRSLSIPSLPFLFPPHE